jgi:hypothetical protein
MYVRLQLRILIDSLSGPEYENLPVPGSIEIAQYSFCKPSASLLPRALGNTPSYGKHTWEIYAVASSS